MTKKRDDDHLNFARALPTWDLIDNLLSERPSARDCKAVLYERMDAVGAQCLIELIAIEAVHSGTPVPVTLNWDRQIVDAGAQVVSLHTVRRKKGTRH